MIVREVFIGGCDRSGTTLLGALLGGHSKAICVPESQFKTEAIRRIRGLPTPSKLVTAAENIADSFRYRLWEIDESPVRAVREGLAGDYPGLLHHLVERYGARHGKAAASIWIDHTPMNLREAVTLRALFPGARFIHIVRDGRAVAASVMPLDWGPNTALEAAPWWAARLAHGFALELAHPDMVTRVRYEDLVRRPVDTLAALCEWLEIDFQEGMTSGAGYRDLPAYTARQHARVGRPPDASRCDAWRDELSPRDIELFEWQTGDLLEILGYERIHGGAASGPTRAERAANRLLDSWRRRVANRLGRRRRRGFIRGPNPQEGK